MLSPMNYMVRSYLRKWDRELNRIAKDCPKVQNEQLAKILNSPYIHYIHNVVQQMSYQDFTKVFPITNYDDVKGKILQLKNDSRLKCKYFAQSAGTTSGQKKLIPTPESFVRLNHLRGTWYTLHTLYAHNSQMSVFKSKNLLVGGSLYEHEDNHTIGDISGIMINRIPHFFRPWYVPSIKEAVSPDWNTKIRITADKARNQSKISLLGGIPTWVLSVCQQVLEKSNKEKLTDVWPNLQAYIHGGVSFEPYRLQFEELINCENFRYIEVYNASEGFFAFQDRPRQAGMLLMCASGVFYEFIKYNDFKNKKYDAISIADVEARVDYVLVISTISGLLRYVQGDVISFVTLSPYRIRVVGRINEFINAFGEDLMLYHVEDALLGVNKKHEVTIVDYTIAPHYLTISSKGRHDWFIEFDKAPLDLITYVKDLDYKLCVLNANYAQKRSNSLALNSLEIHPLPKGAINRYYSKYGNIGGQSKLQKLRNDRVLAERFEAILAEVSLG